VTREILPAKCRYCTLGAALYGFPEQRPDTVLLPESFAIQPDSLPACLVGDYTLPYPSSAYIHIYFLYSTKGAGYPLYFWVKKEPNFVRLFVIAIRLSM
jgi:hypothetical protein